MTVKSSIFANWCGYKFRRVSRFPLKLLLKTPNLLSYSLVITCIMLDCPRCAQVHGTTPPIYYQTQKVSRFCNTTFISHFPCFIIFWFFFFLGPHLQHMARGQTRAVAAGLHQSLQQHWILNPLSKGRGRTHIIMDTITDSLPGEPHWELLPLFEPLFLFPWDFKANPRHQAPWYPPTVIQYY